MSGVCTDCAMASDGDAVACIHGADKPGHVESRSAKQVTRKQLRLQLKHARKSTMEWRKGRGKHSTLVLYAGDREVQVLISPSGRKVRVFVDGQERI